MPQGSSLAHRSRSNDRQGPINTACARKRTARNHDRCTPWGVKRATRHLMTTAVPSEPAWTNAERCQSGPTMMVPFTMFIQHANGMIVVTEGASNVTTFLPGTSSCVMPNPGTTILSVHPVT